MKSDATQLRALLEQSSAADRHRNCESYRDCYWTPEPLPLHSLSLGCAMAAAFPISSDPTSFARRPARP